MTIAEIEKVVLPGVSKLATDGTSGYWFSSVKATVQEKHTRKNIGSSSRDFESHILEISA